MTDKLLEYFDGDDLAASAWLGKYAQEGEETPDDMHRRLAREFARIEQHYIEEESAIGYKNQQYEKKFLSSYGASRENLTEDKIYEYFKDFKYIVPQGSVMSQLGAASIGSLSNCFVIGTPEDSYGGIFQKDEEMAQLMKRRGGVGIDLSTLRPSSTPTSNAAKSSTGAVSFMHRFSNTTREVAQNGRRGALMISMDVNHPDIMDFIKIKRDLTQVTGANISIKLNDEFMKAVEEDTDYILRFPCDITPKYTSGNYNELYKGELGYYKKIKAREYWDEIIKSAHGYAEPGLMFWGAMVDYSPDGVYPQYKPVTTNPCSEIAMQPYDACRLIANNLFSFVVNPFTDKAYFDFDAYYKVNYEAQRLADDLVELELEYITRILKKIDFDPESDIIKLKEKELWLKVYESTLASRRTGLGFTAVGDVVAALGIPYDSDSAMVFYNKLGRTKLQSELDCTIDLAILRGAFEGWNADMEFSVNTEHNGTEPVISGMNDFYQMLVEEFPEQVERMMKYGRRNVSTGTIAPTGTTSLMTRTTSGIEPLFMPFYTRRKKVNPNDKDARIDFVDQNGDSWQEFPVLHPKFKDWCEQHEEQVGIENYKTEELQKLFEASPWYGSTANDIDWIKRVEIQSIMQKYTTHSISSTINLPNDVTEEEVSKIYLESWKKGLKGITVYRDGSRSGVLVSNSINDEKFKQNDAPKRPKELPGIAIKTIIDKVPYSVVVGLMDDKPYEIFLTSDQIKGEGKVVKQARGKYRFVNGVETEITGHMTDEQKAITRLTSASLRHGANIKFIVEQLNKADGDLFSFTKGLARVLKKFIPDGEQSTLKCSDCGGRVIFEEGCNKCIDCGSSKCS